MSGDGTVLVLTLAEENGRGSLEKGKEKEKVVAMIVQRC